MSVENEVEYQPENIDCDDTGGYSNEDEVGEISRADIKNSVDETFKVGKKFNWYIELKDAIKQFETNNGIQLRVCGGSTLSAARRKTPKGVAIANPLLEYYYIHFCCKFSGEPSQCERKRNTSSFRQSCPFFIRLNVSTDGQFVEVKKFVNKHNNHLISKDFIKHLPRQRALNEEETDFVKKAFLLKGNKK